MYTHVTVSYTPTKNTGTANKPKQKYKIILMKSLNKVESSNLRLIFLIHSIYSLSFLNSFAFSIHSILYFLVILSPTHNFSFYYLIIKSFINTCNKKPSISLQQLFRYSFKCNFYKMWTLLWFIILLLRTLYSFNPKIIHLCSFLIYRGLQNNLHYINVIHNYGKVPLTSLKLLK